MILVAGDTDRTLRLTFLRSSRATIASALVTDPAADQMAYC